MNLSRILPVAFAALLPLSLLADPAITAVTAQQRYPWNGKVDISYTVSGDIAATAKQQALVTSLKVTATDQDTGTTYTATTLSGDMELTDGTHSLVWDMDEQGLTLKSTNVVFSVSCETTPATYCVIDLSAGADATSYPVTYLTESPAAVNGKSNKTIHLVMKRIEAGAFKMGGADGIDVTLTKPFFIGLHEVTQGQYQLVTGSNPSNFSGEMFPVDNVSYDDIRGSTNGAQWPASNAVDSSSFLGKLRTRTGLDFDLPTEAQWEYACRAGTTTIYSYGDTVDGNYMWYVSNSGNRSHNAGSRDPNPWGLYDMHGNVWEWCLDWYAAGTSDRVARGGSWNYDASSCTSSYRGRRYPSGVRNDFGFRLARTLNQ